MIIICTFTHVLFVQGFSVIFDFTKLTQWLTSIFEETLAGYIPIDTINDFMLNINPSFDILTPAKVSAFFVYQIVAFVVIGFTLPLRSITWALWYIALSEEKPIVKKGGKRVVRKVSQEVLDRAQGKYQD
jgi:hypothetical protein